ncbi:hypothetical protein [Fictibacillus phosphorivorans]|nr:hypothetical protein [Fictibacillus phosphorivorans]
MSIIKIFFGNKNEKEANCCSVQIVEVSDQDESSCCETETSKEQQNCCV